MERGIVETGWIAAWQGRYLASAPLQAEKGSGRRLDDAKLRCNPVVRRPPEWQRKRHLAQSIQTWECGQMREVPHDGPSCNLRMLSARLDCGPDIPPRDTY